MATQSSASQPETPPPTHAGPIRALILGATGMLGHVLFVRLNARSELDVYGTVRDAGDVDRWASPELAERLRGGIHADRVDTVVRVLEEIRPDVVVNCIGVVKQVPLANDPVTSITVNALFPHQLARACADVGSRMIHFSTDCVFSGDAGNYVESDRTDPVDIYGRTKLLGEVDRPHCVTLRTSLIGHELSGRRSLVEWFLAQRDGVRGFARAIYSGFPTVEMADILADCVIPNPALQGIYHVSTGPISKYDLLCLVRDQYEKSISIERDESFVCDRSLDSSKFRAATGYQPPPWPELVGRMHADFLRSSMYGSPQTED